MAIHPNFDRSPKFNPSQNALIPGFPDELALECFFRVPITSHSSLRLVSHSWKSAVSHHSFYAERRRLGLAEPIVCLIQPHSPPPTEPPGTNKDHHPPTAPIGGLPLYNLNFYNLARREWRRLSMPIPTFAQCVAVPAAGKVVVLGGWDPSTLEPLNRVLVVDLVTGTWKEGSPMLTARSFFATVAATATATVYVAGGHDGQKNALRSAEAYDVAADRWLKLPPMVEERDESQGLSFGDSKFWVVSGYGTDSQGRFRSDAEVYDPETGSWSKVEGVWPFSTATPKSTVAATVGGRKRRWLFAGEGELRGFNWQEKRWERVNSGGVPRQVNGSSSICLVDVGDEDKRIFVMGNCGGECENEGCGGEGVFVLEIGNEDGKDVDGKKAKGGALKWEHVHVPCRFLGLPFSASHLLI